MVNFKFGFDLENVEKVMDYVVREYGENDYELYIGYGDDVMNSIDVSDEIVEDGLFEELIMNCDGMGEFEEDEYSM